METAAAAGMSAPAAPSGSASTSTAAAAATAGLEIGVRLRPVDLLLAALGLMVDLLAAIDAADRVRPLHVAAVDVLVLRHVGPLHAAAARAGAIAGLREIAGLRAIGRAGIVGQPAAELVALGGVRTRTLVESFAGGGVAIADALAVIDVVLPPAVGIDVGAVEVVVDVDRAVDVHV